MAEQDQDAGFRDTISGRKNSDGGQKGMKSEVSRADRRQQSRRSGRCQA
jgi:hypothetical protein